MEQYERINGEYVYHAKAVDGETFSYRHPVLEACFNARDEWLKRKRQQAQSKLAGLSSGQRRKVQSGGFWMNKDGLD
jgi:hypothetical protein